ncbi:MAG: hypothetical protein ABI270_07050 [Nitrosospira sp.]
MGGARPHCRSCCCALLLSGPAAVLAGDGREYRCTPDVKYECTRNQCEKTADDFQQVESFGFNSKTGELSACLWTNCYAAGATVFRNATSARFIAMGRLMPKAHPGNEPVIVSLTIDAGDPRPIRDTMDKELRSFTAVWGYGRKGLSLDMGRCKLEKLP